MRRLATISALLLLTGLALATLGVPPLPSDDCNILHLGGSDDWSIEDHYYEYTDPAEEGDWGNRTPVVTVAASDSENQDADYVCDGVDDRAEIQDAVSYLINNFGGGKVRLFEGTYIFTEKLSHDVAIYGNNISIVGDNRENTVFKDCTTGSGGFWFIFVSYNAENFLLENVTLVGRGRSVNGERNGIKATGPITRAVIKNCAAENHAAIGFYFSGATIAECWVVNCSVRNTGAGGITFAKHTGGVIENNYILNNTVIEAGIGSVKYSGASGIIVGGIYHTVIANNIVQNCGKSGIRIRYFGPYSTNSSENIIVQGNQCFNNDSLDENHAGIWVIGDTDYNTKDIMVRGNRCFDNQDSKTQEHGIKIDENTENCTLDNNYILSNDNCGILLQGSSNDTIINNTASSHPSGIYVYSSDDIRIYHNNFENNTTQAYDDGSNQWDDGYPSGGNYWSDYAGADENHGVNQNIPGPDGMGDTPYQILGGGNQDRYPLINPWPSLPVIIRDVEVSISPDYQSGLPGETFTYTVMVMNQGTVEDTYDLIKGDNAGWGDNLTLDDYLLVVPTGENRTTTLHVHIPDDAIACTEDNITVTARSQENTEVENEASCVAHVVVSRGVTVSISPDNQSTIPGMTLNYTVTVINTGNVSDTYDLGATDNVTPSWNPTLQDNLEVPASESRQATLSVTIPDGTENCTRDNIIVTVRSQENAEVENSASCIAHAIAEIIRGVDVLIGPENQSGVPCTTLDYTVTVKNTGNVQENYALTKSDNAGWGDDVTLDPGWLVVPAGENRTTTLHVHIPDDAIPCTEDNVTVTATSKDNAEIENSASCVAHAVAVIRSVDVLIEPSYQSALAGESIEFTVTVINTGNVSDTYDLGATDNVTPSWNPTLQDNLEVPASENRKATLTVTIPSGAENCTRDNITVTATSVENENVSDNASCVAHAVTERILRVDVEISPGYQEDENGDTLTYTVTVTNRGTVSDTYDLDASDDAIWSPTVSPESLSIAAGASKTATLSVTIPDGAEDCTRDNITVTATSQENIAVENSASCVAHCLVGVAPPLYGVEVSISPSENEGSPGDTVTFTVTVTNLGSAQDDFNLTVDDDLSWGPTLDENLLANLTAGDSQTTTLRVTIPENAAACTRDNITVMATSQGDNTVYAEGSCTAHAVVIEGVSGWPLIIGAIIAATATATGALVARHLKKRKRKKRRRAEARRLRRLKGLIEGEE
jgi:uncharacterized repeat protein (TIGR01451 family)